MAISRLRLYTLVLFGSIVGYAWVAWNFLYAESNDSSLPLQCVFHRVTGIPCPSCGSTRSVVSLLRGKFLDALYLNPLGFVLFAALFLLPVWIVLDFALNKDSFLRFYRRSEEFIRRREVFIIFWLLIAALWIWNIYKGI